MRPDAYARIRLTAALGRSRDVAQATADLAFLVANCSRPFPSLQADALRASSIVGEGKAEHLQAKKALARAAATASWLPSGVKKEMVSRHKQSTVEAKRRRTSCVKSEGPAAEAAAMETDEPGYGWARLPPELMERIIFLLEPRALVASLRVSRAFATVAKLSPRWGAIYSDVVVALPEAAARLPVPEDGPTRWYRAFARVWNGNGCRVVCSRCGELLWLADVMAGAAFKEMLPGSASTRCDGSHSCISVGARQVAASLKGLCGLRALLSGSANSESSASGSDTDTDHEDDRRRFWRK